MALFIPVACGVATTLAGVLSYETGKKVLEKRRKAQSSPKRGRSVQRRVANEQ